MAKPDDPHGILANIIAHGTDGQIQVICEKCRQFHRFTIAEIVALAEKVGPEYSLLNRRCRCRLTAGCDGWNRFFFRSGVYRPLWDDPTSVRWIMEAYRAG